MKGIGISPMQQAQLARRIRPVLDVVAYQPVRDVVDYVEFQENWLAGDSLADVAFDQQAWWRSAGARELIQAIEDDPLERLIELLAGRVEALLRNQNLKAHRSSEAEDTETTSRSKDATSTCERVLVNATEAAAMLGISVNAVRLRTQRGQMPAGSVVRTGRRVQYKAEALRALRSYTKRST